MRLYRDSQLALYIAKNLMFREHTKHIETYCTVIFFRDVVTEGFISPSYAHSYQV